MNTIKKHKEKKTTAKQRRVASGVRRVLGLSSNTPSSETTRVIMLVVLLMIVYIWNNYKAEEKAIEINQLTKENQELRAEYLLLKSKVMHYSSQSLLARRLHDKGIKEATVPPRKLIRKKEGKHE
ncbi:MAG: hypothetical protein C0593_02315 [Marinilabiliales bacterium]|nr:MAG: hypothetical protein C0593_02315 [Marinilabiliales bacterium]